MDNKFKTFSNIDTVHGVCGECEEDTILVAIVSEYYRCTNCGSDTRQHKKNKNKQEKRQKSQKRYKGQG